MANIEDYFIAANSVGAINEEQYKNLDVLIRTAEAISRSLYQSVYLIDYYKKGFLYVSENPLFLCGHTSKERTGLFILFTTCTRGRAADVVGNYRKYSICVYLH